MRRENNCSGRTAKGAASRSRRIPLALAALAAVYAATAGFRAVRLTHPAAVSPLTEAQRQELEAALDAQYPLRRKILKPLPYPVIPAALDVAAESAIAVDVANGCVLYEKNADEVIPPASMTKLAVMEVALQEIDAGRISLSDTVPLPPECWACNMPPHSSLMFLGKNQRVTLEELLTGIAVCSGNDAAYAVALYVCGGMEAFLERMNQEMAALGLEHTHFAEASGYSGRNTTTAREMAAFARAYILRHPAALEKFHSRTSFSYPAEHNLAPEDRGKPRAQDFSGGIPESVTMEIHQKNTNPLLGRMAGCDGLKTGYIDESGYNLALTVRRNGMRILSVTMRGPGKSFSEGNAGRVRDGETIMGWAFSTFAEYDGRAALRAYEVPLVASKEERLRLVPAYRPESLTVPAAAFGSPENPAGQISVRVNLPESVRNGTAAGTPLGSVEYSMAGVLLETVPLVADRTVRKANFLIAAADQAAQLALMIQRDAAARAAAPVSEPAAQ